MIKLQALRGVSAEAPENTMSAFRFAAAQGYDIISVDPAVTKDGKIVALRDQTINRTARTGSGKQIFESISISDITYEEARIYDFGIAFFAKFKAENLPLFSKILSFASENNMAVNVSEKFAYLPEDARKILLEIAKMSGAKLIFTFDSLEAIESFLPQLPESEVHYNGVVDVDILPLIKKIAQGREIAVWVNNHTEKSLCDEIKKYAFLGIKYSNDSNSYDDFDYAVNVLGADIVETTGKFKHDKNIGYIPDMHSHTKNSHDAVSDPDELCKMNIERGVNGCAFTDHCDIGLYGTMDMYANIIESFKDALAMRKKYAGKLDVFTGVEPGEAIWRMEVVHNLITMCDFDVVLGSVHTVRYPKDSHAFSIIDFTDWDKETILDFMDVYFDELWETITTMPCDIMTHLTVPLRYINGKYHKDVDIDLYMDKIKKILRFIIDHGIAMEINTSGIGGTYDVLLPERKFIEMYRDMGGYLITFASDEHSVEKAANAFPETLSLLKEIGFKHIYKYEKRIPIQCTIV
jgi:histidinol-phosphatase (PHP family)